MTEAGIFDTLYSLHRSHFIEFNEFPSFVIVLSSILIVINYRRFCRELSFRSEEERCSRMREELLSLREELSRAHLAKDMLEQQKIETDSLITQIEKSKGATACNLHFNVRSRLPNNILSICIYRICLSCLQLTSSWSWNAYFSKKLMSKMI